MIIVGIDPGQSGGISKLKLDGPRWIPSAIAMPQTERDIADHLWSIYAEAKDSEVELIVFLEHVQPMPAIRRIKTPSGEIRQEVNAGVVSTAKFMQGYGFIRGCVITIGMTLEDVRPQAWQKLLGCMTRGNKNISKSKAQQLFPNLRITHATADCLLIGEYGRRVRLGLSAGVLFERTSAASHTSAGPPLIDALVDYADAGMFEEAEAVVDKAESRMFGITS